MDFGHSRSSSSQVTSTSRDAFQYDDEQALKWAALERLPTYDRARKGLLHGVAGDFKEIDLQKLRIQDRKELLDRLISNADKNEEFLKKLKKRIDRYWGNFFPFVYYFLFPLHFSLTYTNKSYV
jgi:hypothetical protein